MPTMTDLGRERLWSYTRLLMLTAKFDGTIVSANPAWTHKLGWSADEIVGTKFFDLLHPDDLERSVAAAAALSVEGQYLPKFENRYRTKKGDYRDIDWTAVSDGEFIIAIGQDNSEEKTHAHALAEAQEATRQAQKMEAIGHFTGGVAHDFNNLLTVITGSVELLRRPNLSDERRSKFIDAIGDTAERATKLTGQLLAFARRQSLNPKLFDVGESVAEVSNVLRTLTGSRVELEVKLPSEQLFTLADRSQFDTAVINLAINARDAMNGDGRLTISTEAVKGIPKQRQVKAVAGDFVAVTVSDTGSGIEETNIAKIFEPFFTTKKEGLGTGLGLSQVIGFAKQSGGDVHVRSELGLGCSFTIYLPQVSNKDVLLDKTIPVLAVDGEGVCVLVVEDNASVGDFVNRALTELGFDNVLVDSPHRALVELSKKQDRFNVVFTDVVMPGMSGIKLGEEVRRLYPDIAVVLTSGFSHILAQNGPQGFELLRKPYSMEQLSRVLREASAWNAAKRTK